MQALQFSSVQLLSCVQFFVIPWAAARQASLSITSSWSLLKLVSTESVSPSTHLILCHPLLLQPSIFTSIRVFSLTQVNESVLCIRWPKYWSFSFSISPSNEYSGLISFRMDWLDLLTVQGTLKSLLQHHSSKASILQHSAFFTVQLSHPYMTTEKNIALTRQPLLAKECLCFLTCLNMQALLAFKVRHSGFSSSGCKNPVLERLMWASGSLLLGENPVIVISSHLWITHPTVMGFHSTAIPPLVPFSFWFLLHIFSCGKHFLLAFMSFS